MADIQATARVEPKAKLGSGVTIGPYCVVGPGVELGDGVVLHSHVVVTGRTKVGPRTQIFPFASIGHQPQDLKYKGEPSELHIGADNTVREHVTMNPGTLGGDLVTRVGNRGLFMIGVHVAHDCQVGDHVIMANNATLGGHVTIQDHALIGGLAAVHQFVRIGRHAMVGGMSGVENDIIPYGVAMGERAHLRGLNIVGLKRRGFDRGAIRALTEAYETLFGGEDTLSERVERVAHKFAEDDAVNDIIGFVRADSARALCQPKSGTDGGG